LTVAALVAALVAAVVAPDVEVGVGVGVNVAVGTVVGVEVGTNVGISDGAMVGATVAIAGALDAAAVAVKLTLAERDWKKITIKTMMKNTIMGLRARISIPRSPSRSNIAYTPLSAQMIDQPAIVDRTVSVLQEIDFSTDAVEDFMVVEMGQTRRAGRVCTACPSLMS